MNSLSVTIQEINSLASLSIATKFSCKIFIFAIFYSSVRHLEIFPSVKVHILQSCSLGHPTFFDKLLGYTLFKS